jgi:protein-disulfide isomerase
VVAFGLALAGLVVAALLARVHSQAHAGIESFCTVSDVVNCDRVATSPYSVFLGLPVAVWGLIGYAAAAAASGWGLAGRRPHPRWPAGLLFLLAAAASFASVALALVSEFAIGALCLLCAASWTISFALLLAAWRACQPEGVAAAVGADADAVRARPLRFASLAAAAVLGIAVAAVAYPRYWVRAAPPAGTPSAAAPLAPAPPVPAAAAPPAAPGASGARPPAPSRPAGPLTVVVYSDYECPFCALQHEEVRSLLAGRRDVTLVHRQFPLDASCNPLLKKQMHPAACALARAAICADEQGRLEEMDEALFRSQRARVPVEALASRLGLDLARFRSCLSSAEADRRLAADVTAGIRDGVRATPTYVVDGQPYPGRFPAELLPAPAGARGPASGRTVPAEAVPAR